MARETRKQPSRSDERTQEQSPSHRPLFQIEGMRRGSRRVYADLRAVPVPSDSPRSGDLDRPGLRVGGERLRLQAEKFSECVDGGRAAGSTKLLSFTARKKTAKSRVHLALLMPPG